MALSPSQVGAAIGAALFMLSDAVLAINRFAQPLPLAPFWILATCYAAQLLIVRNAVQGAHGVAQESNSPPSLRGGVTPRWR